MITYRQIRTLLDSYAAWKRKRRLYHAYPELRLIDEAERLARRQHKPVEQFRAAKQAAIVHALREGL